MSRTIHFIGANGIPWRVYQPLIKTLEGKGFAVQCDDTVGLEFGTCDDKWGNQDWTHMVRHARQARHIQDVADPAGTQTPA